MKFDTVILCKVTIKMIEKKFKIAAIRIMTSLIISIFLKNYAKNGKDMFFTEINFATAKKIFFPAFGSQDSMQIKYIYVNLPMFLKNL